MTKLTLLHSEQPKLYGVLAILSAIGLRTVDQLSFHWKVYSGNLIQMYDAVYAFTKQCGED